MCSAPVQHQPGASSGAATAEPVPRSTRKRKCRPGYKSPAKLARSRQKAKYFHLASVLKRENFHQTAEVGKLKSYIGIINNCHQEEVTLLENRYTKQHDSLIRKYNQLSEMYSNSQENLLKSEKKTFYLQGQLDGVLDENRSLVRKVSTLEQLRPVYSSVHFPLDLCLRALEEQIRPVNLTQNSPLDLRLHEAEAKPPEFVYDLVNL